MENTNQKAARIAQLKKAAPRLLSLTIPTVIVTFLILTVLPGGRALDSSLQEKQAIRASVEMNLKRELGILEEAKKEYDEVNQRVTKLKEDLTKVSGDIDASLETEPVKS